MPLVASRRVDSFYWLFTWLAVTVNLGRFFDFASPSWLLLYQLVLIESPQVF
jgi:hypothetical protein